MKVSIYTGRDKTKNTGIVYYDEVDHSIMVTHSDIQVRRAVHEYLNTERDFTVPETDQIGSMMLLRKKPCDSISLMEMGLCEMYSTIGVHVNWNSPENVGGSTSSSKKTIADSVNGDATYNVIKR